MRWALGGVRKARTGRDSCVWPRRGVRGVGRRRLDQRTAELVSVGLSAPPPELPALGTGSPPHTHLGLGCASGDSESMVLPGLELKEHGPSRPWPGGAAPALPGPACAPTALAAGELRRAGPGLYPAALSHRPPWPGGPWLEATCVSISGPQPHPGRGSSAHGCGSPASALKLCLWSPHSLPRRPGVHRGSAGPGDWEGVAKPLWAEPSGPRRAWW